MITNDRSQKSVCADPEQYGAYLAPTLLTCPWITVSVALAERETAFTRIILDRREQVSGVMTPAEREARWSLWVWIAIKADSQDEAETVLSTVLGSLRQEMPLRGKPAVRPRNSRDDNDTWIAELAPDLTFYQSIEPDDAKTRCSLVEGCFPGIGVTWSNPVNTAKKARRDWPTDVFSSARAPYVMLHPAVQAVRISCEEKRD